MVRVLEGTDLVIEDLTVTHGAQGIFVTTSNGIAIRHNKAIYNPTRGIVVDQGSHDILIDDNLVEFHGGHGIALFGNVEATVTNNVSRHANQGLIVAVSSAAIVRDNVFEHNEFSGISVAFADASAVVINHIVQRHDRYGIALALARAEIRDNTVEHNGAAGIIIAGESTGNLYDNTVRYNGNDGILISSTSRATVDGGVIFQNAMHGIRIGGEDGIPTIPGQSASDIGLDSSPILEISDNGGAGLYVEDDGSEATIDSRNIVFSNNAEGDIVGNVIDVAP